MSRGNYLDIKTIKKHARELRKNVTESEKQLWEQLRNRRLSGYKFLRQHPIIYKADYKGLNYFIADFYCDTKKAVIELDGSIHNGTEEYDKFRDTEMRFKGLHVLRLKNEELNDMNNALKKIRNYLNSIT
ncbi:MAG: endonuclease domain-containing protein [Bacteroidales bacterium]|nr:endonuclease domain-containing protein [Bacteroidales bacterium]MDP3003410.1 endonuclease domain-containing protein [Bacteroidales bacterium]